MVGCQKCPGLASASHACSRTAGRLTIEAAIVLPVFLVVVLALASLISYPFSCNRIERALTDTARLISLSGYVAHLTGGLSLEREVEKVSGDGIVIGEKRLNELDALLDSLGLATQQDNTVRQVMDAYRQMSRGLTSQAGTAVKSQLQEGMSAMVGELATWRMKQLAALKTGGVGRDKDPWAAIGVVGGRAGVDFSQSQFQASTGELTLTACYRIRPATSFGFSPAVRCKSRVRLRIWGAGTGQGLREPLVFSNDGLPEHETGESLWNHNNDAPLSWNRGLLIEQREMDRIAFNVRRGGDWFAASGVMQAGYDAMSGQVDGDRVQLWQVMSLNPFLSSYNNQQLAVRRAVCRQLDVMPDRGSTIGHPADGTSRTVQLRRIVLVVPVNAPDWIDGLAGEMAMSLAADGAVLEVVRGYGSYQEEPAETD